MNWKNLKSLFVVSDGVTKEESKGENIEKKPTSSNNGNKIVKADDQNADNKIVVPAGETPSAQKGQVQQNFVDHLLKAIEENNMPGIDYLEFKNTLQSFAKMPMDEKLRFESALTAAKTMGATENKIFESANFYLDILAKEEASFSKAVERGKSQKIDGELQRITQMKAQRSEKVKLIEQIKAEIESMTKEINVVSEKVMADQVKIDSKRNHFYASYEFVVNQIKTDVENLKKHTQTEKKP